MREKHTQVYNLEETVLTCSEVNRVSLNTGTSGEEEKQKLLLQELQRENVWLNFIVRVVFFTL